MSLGVENVKAVPSQRYRAKGDCGHALRVRKATSKAWCERCKAHVEVEIVDWGGDRECLDCGASLSRYNPDVFCRPCQERHEKSHKKVMRKEDVPLPEQIVALLPARVTEIAHELEDIDGGTVYMVLQDLIRAERVEKQRDGAWIVYVQVH